MKMYDKKFLMNLDSKTYEQIKKIANKNKMTVSQFIRGLIYFTIDFFNKENKKEVKENGQQTTKN